MYLGFGWRRNAGLVCLCAWRVSVHLVVARRHWVWGHSRDWYDGPIHYFGIGPAILVVYQR